MVPVPENPQRRRSSSSSDSHRPPTPGSVNERTGKPYLESVHAVVDESPAPSLSAASTSSPSNQIWGRSSIRYRKSRADLTRLDAQSSTLPDSPRPEKRAPYRQKLVDRVPRALSDALYEEVFTRREPTGTGAIVATAISSGPRASELLSMRPRILHAADHTADIIPEGRQRKSVLVPYQSRRVSLGSPLTLLRRLQAAGRVGLDDIAGPHGP